MSQVSKLVIAACKRNGVGYSVHDSSGLVVSIQFGRQDFSQSCHLIIANNLGLNSSAVDKLCVDKFYSYQMFADVIDMPNSHAWVDPTAPQPYENFSENKNKEEIASEISKLLQKHTKLVVKPNSKSRGVNVFVCENTQQVSTAVAEVFDQQSYLYDHVVLAQPFLSILHEYRAVVYKKKIQFMYLKNNKKIDAEFQGNISPLHYKNASADLVTDSKLIKRIENWIQPIFSKVNLVYAGLDIVQLPDGRLQLLELNSQPGFSIFLEHNTSEQLDKLLDVVISDLKVKYEKT